MLPATSIWIKRIILLLALFSLSVPAAFSQYYSTGQEAASLRWKQLKTEHVKLIFPDYYEEQARWLGAYMDSVIPYISSSMKHLPRRVPLIMHTRSSYSNGLVAWAPKRMEYYNVPPQDMYAQPWLEQLGLHEYRHVVQIDKLNQGVVKGISWIFGQQGTAAILGLYIPPWFLEGDAITTETALSYSGRGRVPLFETKLRTQVLAQGPYTYDKAVLGSYRDYIPSHYELGYALVAEGRRKYGTELWEHTLNTVARRPYMITPFQKGIRDITGHRKRAFYQECMLGLKDRWFAQDRAVMAPMPMQINPRQKKYTDYRHPHFLNDSTFVALRIPLDDIARFVLIDENGNEEVIFTPGFLKYESLSVEAGKICWLESRPDPRWEHRSYTGIRILEVAGGELTRLDFRQRVYAPALSPDGKQLLAVGVDSLNRYSLLLLDAENGKVIRSMQAPGNAFIQTPAWAGEQLAIAVLVNEDGKNIAKFDLGSGRSKTLMEWGYTDILQPCYHAPHIFFTGGYSGISNLYALNMEEGSVSRVSSSRFGARDPDVSPDGEKMIFADYTPDGYAFVRSELGEQDWEPLEEIHDQSIGLYKAIAAQEQLPPMGSEVIPSDAPVKKYSKLANLFNFHSWAPLDINASSYDIHPGVSIMSQNLLSSSFLSAGYNYNLSEEAGTVYGQYTYSGWYPMIDLRAEYGLRRDYAYVPDKTEVKWNETNLSAGLRLPLDLRRGAYFRGLSLSAYAHQVLRRMKPGTDLRFTQADIFYTSYGVSVYRQLKSNFRDIFPRWGQSLGLYYRYTPFDDRESDIAAAILNLYFPGVIRHQGLNLYAGIQHRDIGYYKFSDMVAYPRGMSGKQDETLLSLRATYALPIAYPDWSIGPVLYLKRIRANLFYDHAFGWNTGNDRDYSSYGTDLLAEVHLLRFIAPLELGVRGAYLPDEQEIAWQFLISIGFSSFYLSDNHD